jgi:hypothetical protein
MADRGVHECPQFGSRDRTTGVGIRKSVGLRQMSTHSGCSGSRVGEGKAVLRCQRWPVPVRVPHSERFNGCPDLICAGVAFRCIEGFPGYRDPLKCITTGPIPPVFTMSVRHPCSTAGSTSIGSPVIVLFDTNWKPFGVPRNINIVHPPEPHHIAPRSSTTASS